MTKFANSASLAMRRGLRDLLLATKLLDSVVFKLLGDLGGSRSFT